MVMGIVMYVLETVLSRLKEIKFSKLHVVGFIHEIRAAEQS